MSTEDVAGLMATTAATWTASSSAGRRSTMIGKFRLIDLSVPLEHQAASEPLPAKIHYVRHEGEGLQQMQRFFGVKTDDLVWSNGQGWAVEELQAITHTGTHVDAPYH